jgi:hypothetical protein
MANPLRYPRFYIFAGRILNASYVEETWQHLFGLACEHDLEGIVAKRCSGVYASGGRETSCFKIRNPRYSQMQGRNEFFDRKGGSKAGIAETDGWAGCVLACAEAGIWRLGLQNLSKNLVPERRADLKGSPPHPRTLAPGHHKRATTFSDSTVPRTDAPDGNAFPAAAPPVHRLKVFAGRASWPTERAIRHRT